MSEVAPFQPTVDQRIAVSLAYIAYSGSNIPQHLVQTASQRTLGLIQTAIQSIPVLCTADGKADWEVVWGPALYTFKEGILEDNAMYVAQRISNPNQYVIAIRGTNGSSILDWMVEDLHVFNKVNWTSPPEVQATGNPQVSDATDIGLNILLSELKPDAGMPGAGMDITTWLARLTDHPVSLLFTGHSLGGALAPTLALWFRQYQGLAQGWDPDNNATISAISFAGPTAGDADFALLSDRLLGERCLRVNNTLDIVPHGWDKAGLAAVRTLYQAGGITLHLLESAMLDFLIDRLNDYDQIDNSLPLTWTIRPGVAYNGFFKQAGTQHYDSYPVLFGVPELNTVIKRS